LKIQREKQGIRELKIDNIVGKRLQTYNYELINDLIIHPNQLYEDDMYQIFFIELVISNTEYCLKISFNTQGK